MAATVESQDGLQNCPSMTGKYQYCCYNVQYSKSLRKQCICHTLSRGLPTTAEIGTCDRQLSQEVNELASLLVLVNNYLLSIGCYFYMSSFYLTNFSYTFIVVIYVPIIYTVCICICFFANSLY